MAWSRAEGNPGFAEAKERAAKQKKYDTEDFYKEIFAELDSRAAASAKKRQERMERLNEMNADPYKHGRKTGRFFAMHMGDARKESRAELADMERQKRIEAVAAELAKKDIEAGKVNRDNSWFWFMDDNAADFADKYYKQAAELVDREQSEAEAEAADMREQKSAAESVKKWQDEREDKLVHNIEWANKQRRLKNDKKAGRTFEFTDIAGGKHDFYTPAGSFTKFVQDLMNGNWMDENVRENRRAMRERLGRDRAALKDSLEEERIQAERDAESAERYVEYMDALAASRRGEKLVAPLKAEMEARKRAEDVIAGTSLPRPRHSWELPVGSEFARQDDTPELQAARTIFPKTMKSESHYPVKRSDWDWEDIAVR